MLNAVTKSEVVVWVPVGSLLFAPAGWIKSQWVVEEVGIFHFGDTWHLHQCTWFDGNICPPECVFLFACPLQMTKWVQSCGFHDDTYMIDQKVNNSS